MHAMACCDFGMGFNHDTSCMAKFLLSHTAMQAVELYARDLAWTGWGSVTVKATTVYVCMYVCIYVYIYIYIYMYIYVYM